MTLCNRCKTNVASMVHSTRKRKDGSIYRVYWCRECQRKRVNKYNEKARFYERIKDPHGWKAEAKIVELRIAAKYAPKANIRTGDTLLV